jgi:hypothetical protein
MEMSKGEFAASIGVSAGRVSQMIASGIIGRDALKGEGRGARIIAEVARRQIADRRHPGQAMGNGLQTRLDMDGGLDEEASRQVPASPPLLKDDPAKQILVERLEQEQRKNRMARIEEARQLGELVLAEDMQRAIGKALSDQLAIFTGMAPDIANAIAAKFELPQRDVLHLVRQVMNEKRGVAAAKVRSAGAAMAETVETELGAA